MKYIKNNYTGYYQLVKQEKMHLFQYADGNAIFDKFLEGIFEKDIETINYLKDELDVNTLTELLEKVRIINEFPTDEEIKN